MPQEQKSNTAVIIGPCRFSYAHVFEPTSIQPDGKKKYNISIIIEKTDKKNLKLINKAVEAAIEAGKGKWGGKIPKKLKLPLRDGDEERDEDENYENSYFLGASSDIQPGIVDKKLKPILDRTEFYSGCYGMASLNFYAFNTAGNQGIACGLNNLMKTKDGEPLSGKVSAEDDFKGFADDDDDDEDDDDL